MKRNKNKILLVIAIVCFLGIGLKANASISYSRTPSGLEITSPVNIQISIANYTDLNCGGGNSYWTAGIYTLSEGYYILQAYGSILASTELNFNENFDLANGDYIIVNVICCQNSACNYKGETMYPKLEFNGEATIFTIVSPPPPPPYTPIYASISAGSVANIMAYSSELLGDLGPAVAMVIGIPVGFWVIWQVINIIRRKRGL